MQGGGEAFDWSHLIQKRHPKVDILDQIVYQLSITA